MAAVTGQELAAGDRDPAGERTAAGGRPRAGDSVREVVGRLQAAGVRAVRLTVVDNAGVHRVKCVPVQRLPAAVAAGVGISTLLSVWTIDDSFAHARFADPDRPSDDLRLFPDLAACVPLAGEPGWAWCPADQFTQEGTAWPACPRGFLRRMVEELAAEGLRLRGAFETEWYLHRPTGDGLGVPINAGPGYSAVATTGAPFLLEIIDALGRCDVEVQQFHAEYSPAQFEASVAPADPVRAADTAVLTRQVIRGVAEANGLLALFAPKVRADALGSGAHFHLSLSDSAGRNLYAGGGGPGGMTRAAEAFSAGILAELPALLAVSAPSVLSYLRLRPGTASGAFQAWGVENREAALRLVTGLTGTRSTAANIEYKPADGTANPYLLVGCLIAAGLAGLRTGAVLPPPTSAAPGSLSAEQRRELGIADVPDSLAAAIAALERSAVLRAAMGEPLFDTFLATRRHECASYADTDEPTLLATQAARY